MANRWLRRWSDENGEVCAIVREKGGYFSRYTIPAWEPHAGMRTMRRLSKSEAQSFDFDEYGEFSYTENEQAHMEHDSFFG